MDRSPHHHPSRHATRMRAAVTCVILGLLAASCGGGGGDGGGGESGAGEEVTPAAVQELVVGSAEDPWVDSSESDRKRIANYPLNTDVCQTLVVLTPEFGVGEGLATKWEFVGDNTFRFTLRDGVRFSDGTPVTAEAVKYSLDYTVQKPSTSGFAFLGPDSTKVVDERTVEVRPTEANLRLVEQLTHPTYSVMKPGSDPFTDVNSLVCSGPFKVSEYAPRERIVVVRNDNYWGAQQAKLSKITFRFIPDDTTRTLALQNGEVDLITDVPRGVLSTIETLPGVKVEEAPVGQVYLGYVARRDQAGNPRLLADPLLRKAIAHSIDQEEYVQGVLDGHGKVVEMVAPPEVLGEFADRVKGFPYDPEEARRLLDQAGWTPGPDGIRMKDGRPLEVAMIFARVELTTLEWVQAQLREVGIKANIVQLEPAAYRDRLKTGDYDLDFSGPNQNDANPAFLLSLRWYSKATGDNAPIISPGPDTDFEAAVDKTQLAVDYEELQRLAAEAMHQLVDVEVGAIPLGGVSRIYAMKEKVHGLDTHPSGTNQRWSTVFIAA